jgi:Ni,Fe-hydrogenase maturation factor
LIAEVKAGRAQVFAQTERITALEAQVTVEQSNASSIAKSYESSVREIESLRSANSALERAIVLHEQSIAILQDREKTLSREVKKQRKRAVVAGLIAVGTIASRLLL